MSSDLIEPKMDRLTLCFCVCSFSSPAGRRNPDVDRGSEDERSCGHRTVTTDPRAAGTETQPDGKERGDMTKLYTEPQHAHEHTHTLSVDMRHGTKCSKTVFYTENSLEVFSQLLCFKMKCM